MMRALVVVVGLLVLPTSIVMARPFVEVDIDVSGEEAAPASAPLADQPKDAEVTRPKQQYEPPSPISPCGSLTHRPRALLLEALWRLAGDARRQRR